MRITTDRRPTSNPAAAACARCSYTVPLMCSYPHNCNGSCSDASFTRPLYSELVDNLTATLLFSIFLPPWMLTTRPQFDVAAAAILLMLAVFMQTQSSMPLHRLRASAIERHPAVDNVTKRALIYLGWLSSYR